MKKIMVVAAAFAMALSVNAAAVTWNSGNLTDHTGVADSLKNATAYTATLYIFSDSAGNNDVTSTFGSGTQISDTSATKNGAYSGTTKDTGIASGTYYAKLVIANSEWTLTSDLAAFTYDADAVSAKSINFLSGAGFNDVTAKIHLGGTNNGWQAVPEPTSGLLLLLGVAGLALKRKRA